MFVLHAVQSRWFEWFRAVFGGPADFLRLRGWHAERHVRLPLQRGTPAGSVLAICPPNPVDCALNFGPELMHVPFPVWTNQWHET